jgi:hypothetical protein
LEDIERLEAVVLGLVSANLQGKQLTEADKRDEAECTVTH